MYYTAKATKLKQVISPIILFIALLIIGFFLSDMFVETAERYAQIMYPLFTVVAVLAFALLKNRRSTPAS